MIGSLTPQCHTDLAIYALYDVAFHVNYHVSPLIYETFRGSIALQPYLLAVYA